MQGVSQGSPAIPPVCVCSWRLIYFVFSRAVLVPPGCTCTLTVAAATSAMDHLTQELFFGTFEVALAKVPGRVLPFASGMSRCRCRCILPFPALHYAVRTDRGQALLRRERIERRR